MKLLLTSAPLALLLFFGLAGSAFAQSHADFVYDSYVAKHFDQSAVLALEVNTGLDTSVSSDSDDSLLETNVSGEAGVDVSGSDETSSASATGTGSAIIDFGAPLIINRASLSTDGSMGVRAEGERAMLTVGDVSSRADLEAYASSRLSASEHVESAEFSSERMRIAFKEEGRLLGFIPVTMTSHAEVMADGSVEVSRPWYRFMVTGAGSATAEADLESRIEAAVRASADAVASASGSASADASLSASTQARVLDEILASVEAGAQASANGSASY